MALATPRAKPRSDEPSTTDQIVAYLHHHWPNSEGLPDLPGAAPTAPPVNRDVPYVSQAGEVLSCTMGNWEGEPDSYAYQWKRDTTSVGDGSASYAIVAADAGHTLTCVVTATNAAGSTAAPPSNGVAVPAARHA